jgi:hypothetical protein
MHKTIIVSLAVLGLSTSAAFAANAHHAKHHAKKPAAAAAATTAPNQSGPMNPMPFGAASSADHERYLKNKQESGVK